MRSITVKLLVIVIAANTVACAFESEEDEVEKDSFEVEPRGGKSLIEGGLSDTKAISSEAMPASVASEGRRIEVPPAEVSQIDCSLHETIPWSAYNGEYGEAMCWYGRTLVPSYLTLFHEFIIGTNSRVYHDYYHENPYWASGWEDQGGFATSGVWAGTVGNNTLRICVRGDDYATWWLKEYVPGRGWTSWRNAGNGAQCPVQYRPEPFPG